MLGTTKPPYTLALMAALLRDRGCDVRVVDLRPRRPSTDRRRGSTGSRSIRRWSCFPARRPRSMRTSWRWPGSRRRFGAPLFCFGPHASSTPEESMERAPPWTPCSWVSPKTAWSPSRNGLAREPRGDPEPDVPPWRVTCRTALKARSSASPTRRIRPGICSTLDRIRCHRGPYVLVETSRGCPYSCDLLGRADSPGAQVPRKERQGPRRRTRTRVSHVRPQFFYLWGDTVTLNVKTFSAFCDGSSHESSPSSGSAMRVPTT